ncbi:hypothetical protein LCGC14_0404230 [marine sediment metagenome]|uniref:Uncharacterized protein n=1 Tax=marine sediment metagenome TaxID=412755 RepID=A0A0F9T1J1_9ZZZZ
MVKHSFKKGDKVKLKPEFINRFGQKTKVGKVVGFDNLYVLVQYKGNDYGGFPYLPTEIEPAIKVGEQLQFDFMKGD